MINKRVVFVEPSGAPSNIFAKYMTIPLLGPVYLGTIARAAGYHVEILNENILGRPLSADELGNVDILCLSCVTATINRGKEIAAQYREVRAKAGRASRVLVGGIHASMIPDDVKDHFDQVITGEAETIILDLLSGALTDPLIRGRKLEELDTLPIPDFTLVRGWKKMSVWPVMTSRGCPYDCNFCSVTEMFGREYRAQSPARVLEEIMPLQRARKKWIFFVDDHFAANMGRTEEILDRMIAQRFNRPWGAQVRTEVTKKPEVIAKMRKAGCRIVYVGFESVNPEALKDMNKRQTVEDIKRTVEVFHRHGVDVHGMFVLGSDSDTKETFKLTSDFCRESRLDYVQFSILTPLPGTRVFRQLEGENRLYHRDWSRYDGLHAVFSPKRMSVDDLQHGMIDCFSDFYSYTNAANDALNLVPDFVVTALKGIFTSVSFPSPMPMVMKVVGKGIIKEWMKKNRGYLSYLDKLSMKPKVLSA